MNEIERQPKKPSQSLTVRAALAQAILPLITFWIAKKLGTDSETAGVIAAAVFGAFAALANVGLRRAAGGFSALLIVLTLSGCCNHPDYRPTFQALEKGFSSLKDKFQKGYVNRLDPHDPKNQELNENWRASAIATCSDGANLCREALRGIK